MEDQHLVIAKLADILNGEEGNRLFNHAFAGLMPLREVMD
jgi:hypothetical protein